MRCRSIFTPILSGLLRAEISYELLWDHRGPKEAAIYEIIGKHRDNWEEQSMDVTRIIAKEVEMATVREAEEINTEDLEAAAEVYDKLTLKEAAMAPAPEICELFKFDEPRRARVKKDWHEGGKEHWVFGVLQVGKRFWALVTPKEMEPGDEDFEFVKAESLEVMYERVDTVSLSYVIKENSRTGGLI